MNTNHPLFRFLVIVLFAFESICAADDTIYNLTRALYGQHSGYYSFGGVIDDATDDTTREKFFKATVDAAAKAYGAKKKYQTYYMQENDRYGHAFYDEAKYDAEENPAPVKWLTDKNEQKKMQIEFTKDGIAMANGKPIRADVHGYMAVMDENGKFYIVANGNYSEAKGAYGTNGTAEVQYGKPHHSTFLGGGNVAWAGHLFFGQDGKITGIDNASGHYLPGPESIAQAVLSLNAQGAKVDDLELRFERGNQWDNNLHVRSFHVRADGRPIHSVTQGQSCENGYVGTGVNIAL